MKFQSINEELYEKLEIEQETTCFYMEDMMKTLANQSPNFIFFWISRG